MSIPREPYLDDGGRIVIQDPHVSEFGTGKPAGCGLDTCRDRLLDAASRYQRSVSYADEHPEYAHGGDDVDLACEQLALAARDLVRHVEADPREYSRPVGWEDSPVHGKPDDPSWPTHREHRCGRCGAVFGSNCAPGDVCCPNCDAWLCASCGHWQGEVP